MPPKKRPISEISGGEEEQPLGVDNPNSTSKRTKLHRDVYVNAGMDTPRTGVRANNGELHLYFVSMGQGDCTILITPAGHAFMFDIGSSAWDDIVVDNHRQEIVDFLQSNMIFGVNSTLKGLVITHSDEDHNNRSYILGAMSVAAETVYHTNVFNQYDKNPKGGKEQISTMLLRLNRTMTGLSFTSTQQTPPPIPGFATLFPQGRKFIPAVLAKDHDYAPVRPYQSYRLNTGASAVLTQVNPPPALTTPPAAQFVPYWAEGQGFVIHDEVLNEKRCTIRILVANYRDFADCYDMTMPTKKSSNEKLTALRNRWRIPYTAKVIANLLDPREEGRDANQASAMILIQYSDASGDDTIEENYLICGDATYSTLDMVMREYPELKDVTILQAPHHGAATELSDSPDFIQRMNPKIAVYSAPYYGERFGHPSGSSVRAVENVMQASGNTSAAVKSNYIFWDDGNRYFTTCTNEPYRIYVTGWMKDGYFHYSPPYAPDTNIPKFRRDILTPKSTKK